MDVLVAYGSRLGSTQAIARRIAARLETHGLRVVTHDFKTPIDPLAFDAFVLGSAVYAGHWLATARAFVRDQEDILSTRPTWFFSSGPLGASTASEASIPSDVFGLEQTIRANGHRVFAGSFAREGIEHADFGMAERLIARRFIKEGDFRDWAGIEAWADEIAADLMKEPVLV